MKPITQQWPGTRAVLFVHGVGDAKPGDYTDLVAAVKTALGPRAGEFAFYELYYNFINDWFKDKTALAGKLQQAKALFKVGVGEPDLAEAIAEYAGDVLWPVLSRSARAAVREAYLAQLKQIVRDGITAGVGPPLQQLTIITHSLGCFYTYEALHAAASKPSHGLQPVDDGVRFENVILMAAPIQLLRTMGDGLGPVVPNKSELSTFDKAGLSLPGQVNETNNEWVPTARRWVSIAGELDPIAGYFFRKRAHWAYTEIEGQLSIIDPQTLLNDIQSKEDLIKVLVSSLAEKKAPQISIKNPHSWTGYVTRHEKELQQWLTA